MKVLVTGATGFVGRHVVEALQREGDEVVAVVRPGTAGQRFTGADAPPAVEADLLTPAGRAAIVAERADVVVHAAWFVQPGAYLASPANVDWLSATVDLARDLAHAGLRRFVGVGTCFELDTRAGLLAEDAPPAPAHLYSACKAAADMTIRQLAAITGMQAAWARLFYLYGPHEYPSRLVPAVARALLRGEVAPSSPGEQVRDFLHVEDAGAAIAAVARSSIVGPVHVASGRPTTVGAIVRQLGQLSGRGDLVRVGALPYAPSDPMFVCARIDRLRAETAFRPRWTLETGLASTFEWWRERERSAAR